MFYFQNLLLVNHMITIIHIQISFVFAFVLQYHNTRISVSASPTKQNKNIIAHSCPMQWLWLSQCHHNQRNKSIAHRAQRCLCVCNYCMSDQTCAEWGSIRQRCRLIEAIETHQMRQWALFDVLETKYCIVSWGKLDCFELCCQSKQTTSYDFRMSEAKIVPL